MRPCDFEKPMEEDELIIFVDTETMSEEELLGPEQ